MRKYQHLREQVQEMTKASNMEFVRFPSRVHGKWDAGGSYRPWALENPTTERWFGSSAETALFTSVYIVGDFVSHR